MLELEGAASAERGFSLRCGRRRWRRRLGQQRRQPQQRATIIRVAGLAIPPKDHEQRPFAERLRRGRLLAFLRRDRRAVQGAEAV